MSMPLIDLHGHTIESDGTLTIAEYVKKAHDMGLAAVAMTNHDTVMGVNQFVEEVSNYPDLIGIAGVELKAQFPKEVIAKPLKARLEILAIDIQSVRPLEMYEHLLSQYRKDAALKRIELLNEHGISITFDDIAYDSEGRLRKMVGQPHIANYLVTHGYAASYQEVFDKCLGVGGPAYVEQKQFSTKEVADIISQSGALRIAAHPQSLNLSDAELYHFMKVLKEKGVLDGFEVMHPDHSFKQMETYLDIAEALNMFISGGSDFHGSNKPQIEMGRGNIVDFSNGNIAVPEMLLDSIRNRRPPSKSEYAEMRRRIHNLKSLYNQQEKNAYMQAVSDRSFTR